MELLNDPVKVGVATALVAVGAFYFLGLTHIVTLGVAIVGGLLTLRAAVQK
jgi:hypothetical protein